MSVVRAFVRGCIRSRLGWLLVCLHAAWFVFAVANMSPPAPEFAKYLDNGGWSSAALLAGRPFHFAYESIPLKVVFLIDLPAMLAAAVVGLVLSPALRAFHVGHFVGRILERF